MKIGLLMGGLSSEREVSLATGNNIYNYLDKSKYTVIPIEWNIDDTFSVFEDNSFEDIKCKYQCINSLFSSETFDVIFLALHGTEGEDGTIQAFLDLINIPYTGSNMKSSLVGMNKYLSKLLIKENNLDTPKYLFKSSFDSIEDFSKKVTKEIGFPCFVKPNSSGSSIGTSKANDEKQLLDALYLANKEDAEVLVEEAIEGTEITVGVLEENGEIIALPIVEIETDSAFFDYNSKYDMSVTKEIIPARIEKEIEIAAKEAGVKMHRIFGCTGYSRTDILIKDNKLYILEINTLPGFTKESLFPKMAKAQGYNISEILDSFIKSAIDQR